MNLAIPVPHSANAPVQVLPNGVHITLEPRPHAASAAVVLWLAGGTREEGADAAGHLHTLEHLLLRRTTHSDAPALARRIAALGGMVNAETGREHLALIGRAPAGQAPALAALLVECLCEPGFDAADLALEMGVIAAERTFVGHTPPHEALIRLAWPQHPLGWPLLPADPAPVSTAALRTLWAHQAVGSRLRVAVVGGFDPPTMNAALGPLEALPTGAGPAWGAAPRFVPGRYGRLRENRPATLLWALACTPYSADDVAPWELTAALLQHTLTDTLHENGLAYACAVWPEFYSDAGLIVVHVAAPPGRVARCAGQVERQLDVLAAGSPPPDDIALARQALAARAALAADDLESAARAAAVAHHPVRGVPPTFACAATPPSNSTLRLVTTG